MEEEKCLCKCKCSSNDDAPIIGSIIAYELAVVIFLLIFIFDKLSKQSNNDHAQSKEEK